MQAVKLALLRGFLWVLSLVPARLLTWLSHPLGRLLWRFSGTRRNSTLKNLGACFPDKDPEELDRLGRESMRHFVMIALETGMCWYWSQKRLERHFHPPQGLADLDSAVAEGRGVLVLVPHFGNWELMNHWTQFRHDLMALYKPSGSPALEAAVVKNRCRFGAGMTPTTGAGLKRLYRHARQGKLVAILPDQDPSDGQGRFAPFFGVPALTGVLAVRLIQKTGCRVMFCACRRTDQARYQAHFLEADPAIYDTDIDTAVAALNRGVEAVVALDPAQYLWAYKRFKSRPEGEPPFY